MLGIDGARKRFGETDSLNGITLDIPAGRWLGLLGPNGAGKTALVRAVMGRVTLDAGTIRLDGVNLDRSPEAACARAATGFIPQDVAVHPDLTVEENLRAWRELSGVGAELGERIEWALDWTGLSDRRRHRVSRFSGGMKRRLNLAAGVLHRPRLLLLDEPTVGVDPQSRSRIWEMFGELHANGTTLLLTTHQLDEAQRVSRRWAAPSPPNNGAWSNEARRPCGRRAMGMGRPREASPVSFPSPPVPRERSVSPTSRMARTRWSPTMRPASA